MTEIVMNGSPWSCARRQNWVEEDIRGERTSRAKVPQGGKIFWERGIQSDRLGAEGRARVKGPEISAFPAPGLYTEAQDEQGHWVPVGGFHTPFRKVSLGIGWR